MEIKVYSLWMFSERMAIRDKEGIIMANTCAICGTTINVFQSQKLADGNYICRKECCKKALTKYFDFVHATLPEYQSHVAQVERGTKIWEQLFISRLKTKDKDEKLEQHYQPMIVAPSLGLVALLETRYKFMNFGKSEHACVFRLDDLVCYQTEKETKTVDGKEQAEYYIHYAFRNTSGLADFRVRYAGASECQAVEKYFNKLFGIQKTLGNSINNSKRQMNAIKDIASAVSAAAKGEDAAESKVDAALDSLDIAVYGDRSQLKARADAALAAFGG